MPKRPFRPKPLRPIRTSVELRIGRGRPRVTVSLELGPRAGRLAVGPRGVRHDLPRPGFADVWPGAPRDWTDVTSFLDGRRFPRRPRRKPPGGEPVPVEPQPKPTPLIGGAEAPIE